MKTLKKVSVFQKIFIEGKAMKTFKVFNYFNNTQYHFLEKPIFFQLALK